MIEPMNMGSRCDRHVGEAFPVRCEECTMTPPRDLATTGAATSDEAAPVTWPAVAATHDEWLPE